MGQSEKEIQILFTGIRPGEKIAEQLYLRGDEIETEHPDILTLPNGDSNPVTENQSELTTSVDKIIEYAKSSNQESIFELNELIKRTSLIPKAKQEKAAFSLVSSSTDH